MATRYKILATNKYPDAGATSGKIVKSNGTIFVASTETYAAPGTSGNVLTSDGTNWTSAAPAGSGDVSKVGTPVNNQIGVWTGDGTIEGDTDLTFDTSTNTFTTVNGVLTKVGIGAGVDASRLLYVTGDVSGGVATIQRTNASTNASVGTVIIKGKSSGDMTDGFGSAFQFAIEDTANVENLIANIQGIRDGADNSGALVFATYNAGTPAVGMSIYSDQKAVFNVGIEPDTNDGATIGSASFQWSDLFLAEGAVINWDNGDVTLTQSGNSLTLAGGDLVLPSAGLTMGSSIPFSDSAGTLTLQNVDALDATTEATIEAAIDTLANLTSVQGRTVTLADAGADAIFGWDDSANAYQNLSAADVRTALSLVVGTNVQAYDADLTTWAGITPGTGVGTALAINVGSAGAFVTFNGALGTPSSGVATNLTGTASGLTAGTVTTNANLTGHITSTGNAAVLGSFTIAQLNTAVSDANIIPEAGGTFTGDISVPDEAYGAGWNGSLEVPTKNALYDKIETLGGGGGEAVTKDINQTSHGLSVGELVKFTGSAYDEAQADSAANAEVIGIVSAVADANNFTLLTEGYIDTLSGLTANTTYFLSASSAGALTATEPSTAGQVSKPVLRAVSTTAGYFFNQRGMVIPASGSGSVKELFIPVTYNSPVTNMSTPTYAYNSNGGGTFPTADLQSTGGCVFIFKVPSDFTSITNLEVMIWPDATETIQWDLEASFRAVGENMSSGVVSYTNKTLGVTTDLLTAVDINLDSIFATMVADDYVQISFLSDTTQIRPIGLRFKYS